MKILKRAKKKIVDGRRPISFAMAMLIAGMSCFPSIPGNMTAFAALNDGQEQGVTPGTNPDGTIPNGNKPQDVYDTARVYVNNTPIRLEVSKVKTQVGDHEGILPNDTNAPKENTITYRLSGRVEGSESELMQKYDSRNIELAYSGNGTYLGYGWARGTLEYLQYREKHKDEFGDASVNLIYNEYGVFTGYAYVTRKLETADDINRYVAGATMTLYDAIEIFRMPDYDKDDRFAGVTVERNANGDVTSVYVNKGYAGTKIEYVQEETDENKISVDNNWVKRDDNYTYQDEINEKGEAVWIAKTVQREDTPILYYSLSDLHITSNDTYYTDAASNEREIDRVFGNERPDKTHKLYGFDRYGSLVDITQKDQLDFSIFAFEEGNTRPIFEIAGGDLTEVRYDGISKTIQVGEDTLIYHLDDDGNRDALTDPRTGIAYIEEEIKNPGGSSDIHSGNGGATKIYVWPVNIYKDGTGSETFEKIKTNRVATINADTENEYTIGTYSGNSFDKSVNPTLDEHGMPIYYQKSDKTYVKGADRYDRDGDYLGYGYTDQLDNENLNAYGIKDHDDLYNGDEDNPFDQATHYQYSTAQKIVVTVDAVGNYIVNGAETIPTPVRDGFVFGGWLVQPKQLKDGMTVNALWRNTGSMTEEQKDRWYSDRSATGTTTQMTIEFNANGGMFTDGSGDIHSSDNKLYYRQGEAFLIENTWVTGENTPNDPFDIQRVNTIDQTSDTANDPYSSTNNGGLADMLKRVAVGNYIMEEVESPVGYVKGLPVGVTVNESDQIQTAEMVDTTIKIQIIKTDNTDSYDYNIYEDGILKKNPDGTNVKYKEQTGNFSYENVKGATLALKADSSIQKDYNDWIKATNHPQIQKVNDNGNWYITFQSDEPLYIEGLPKGNYTLSEIVTPNGYVTAGEKQILVNETTELITYFMNDDHTKVEINKFYNDGSGNVVMPNIYNAGLELRDKDGNIVASWNTDDVSDYTSTVETNGGFFNSLLGRSTSSGFIENYEKLINSGDHNFNSISWEVERTATKKAGTGAREVWYVSDGSKVEILDHEIPVTAPEGFEYAYNHRNMDAELNSFKYTITYTATKVSGNGLSNQIWRTNTGKQIHINAYRSNLTTTAGKQGYIFEYKFNYKDDYPGKYENMVSYDTVIGTHRFDYLPTGTYTIHEARVPEGFVKADDRTVVINETEDIQLFNIENVRKELVIAKVAMDDKSELFAGTVGGNIVTNKEIGLILPGANLKLYKVKDFNEATKQAFINGTIPSDAVLVDEWVSGSDGEYTLADERKELIPKGFKVGDLKPHTVTEIENGKYYLVEAKTPDFYRTAEPIEITVSDTTTASSISKVSMINQEMTGKIIVHKTNSEGSDLSDAVFIVKNKLTGETVGTLTTKNGYGELIIDDIGYFDESGNIIPYAFTIQETDAPAGYSVNGEIHEFMFKADSHSNSAIAVNEDDESLNNGILSVVDDVTGITINKSDYETGNGVPGTELQVFEAEFNEEWTATNITRDSWKWTTTETTNSHSLSGLVAGKSYVLKELKAPDGYTLASDMFFKVSSDGNRIERIWYDKTENPFIQFDSDGTGTVSSVQIATRSIKGSYVALTDLEDNSVKNLGLLVDGLVLTEDEITQGKTYRVDETVVYSDGTESVIGTTTFAADLTNGTMKLNTRYAVNLLTTIIDSDGEVIASFNPDGTTKKIDNAIDEDMQEIIVTGNGKDHSAINTSSSNVSAVAYTVKVEEAGSTVIWTPDQQTTVLRTEPAVQAENNVYTWTTTKDNETIKFSTILKDGATGYVDQKVSINGKDYSYMNPIAVNAGDGIYQNTSKLSVFNEVRGTDPNNTAYEFMYKITMTKEDGSPLDGSYAYRTKDGKYHLFEAFGKAKTIDVVLTGNDYVVVNDLPYGTNYSVRLVDPSGDGFSVKNSVADAKTTASSIANVLFTNERNISSDRNMFKKNYSYTVVETTLLNDGTSLESEKRGFSIGENCEVISFDIKNKPTIVTVDKVDKTFAKLIGARLAILDKNGNEIKQWTSTGIGETFKAELKSGEEYVLREIAPTHGYAYADDIKFTVSTNGTTDKIIMTDNETKVKVLKVDGNGNGLDGAMLQILDENKNPVKARLTDDVFEAGKDMTFASKVTGVAITGQLDANTSYYLRELVNPSGFYLESEDVPFTTNKNNTIKVVNFANKETIVRISKTDGKKEIAGATLTVKDADGNIVDTWVSTTKAHEIKGLLIAGKKYILHEDIAPDGYYYGNDVEFTIPLHDEGIINVAMKDEPTRVHFQKTDYTTTEEVPGAHCQLKDKEGNIIEEWTSTTEDHIIEGKLNPGETYFYHEEGAPDGYYYSEDIEFTVPLNDEGIVKVEMKDKATNIRVLKVDAQTGTPVISATLQILDKDNHVVEEWVSDGKAHEMIAKLNAEETYTLHEKGIPDGYHRAEDIEFTVPRTDNGVIKLEMKDPQTEVEFKKTDFVTGQEISGAKLQIRDANGDVVDEWVSTSEPHIIKGGLVAGQTYYLYETEAPDGYYRAKEIMFSIPTDENKTVKVEMKDKPTKVEISKTDIATGKELPGAKLQIIDKDGKVIEEWISQNEPHVITSKLKTGESYTLKEVAAPDGYYYAEEVSFTVPMNEPENGKLKVQMNDSPTEVHFQKTDYTTTEEVPGAHCQLKDKEGNIIEEWTSTTEDHIIKGKLKAGETYFYHEEGAPDGYAYSEDIEFTVPLNGSEIVKVEMKDKATHVVFRKTDVTETKELEGAHIQIKDESGKVVTEWTSTSQPHVLDGVLSVETVYYMHEEGAPDGYGYATDISFKIDKDNVVLVFNPQSEEWEAAEDSLVEMIDEILKLEIQKIEKDSKTMIGGAKLQILDSTGKVCEEWITETGKAHQIIGSFADGTPLKAGELYTLVEAEAPEGYEKAANQTFPVSRDASLKVVVMTDEKKPKEPAKMTFTKEDFAGKEIPGATCVLTKVNPDGSEKEIDRWVSTTEPRVEEGILETDTTYRYHEEMAPEGYGYSETIEFTVDKDGKVVNAHYINEDGKPVLYDKDGFQTGIVVNPDGTYEHDGHTITIDANGNAVDEKGEIHAEGVEFEIPVIDNVVRMKDAPTQMNLVKVDELGNPLSGGKFQIVNTDGTLVLAVKDTKINSVAHSGNIKAGEPIIFKANGTLAGINITGQLKAGTGYILKEIEAPDGYSLTSDKWFYIPYLNQKEPVVVKMTDEPERELTRVSFIKEDYAGKEIPGATCVLTKVNPDGSEKEIDRWVSTTEPRVEQGTMERDTTYRYHEELAPEGYGYSETIEFTVDKDGFIINAHYINEDGKPVLHDKDGFQTGIVVNPDGTYEHDGHTITIDANGNAVDENGEIHAEGVEFEIPVIDNVVQMKDAPTQMNLIKVDENSKALSGGKFQIFNTDGTPVLAVKDTLMKSTEHSGNIKAGEALIFEANGTLTGVNVTGQLKAGTNYILRELVAPDGYVVGPDAKFYVPYLNQKEPIVVRMENEPERELTKVSFIKEDFAGKEIPGATCVLTKVNPDGSEKEIDKWVSTTEPRVEEGILETDTTYRYHEELAPEGYGYSETIEFTVDKDGKVVNAHYINEDGKPVLYDKDGFQTGIVVNPDGTYEHDGHTITIDANGNAVDENGEIHAEGVGFEIPVINNVVQMKDAPTQMNLVKVDKDDKALSGGKFQIFNTDGTPVKAIKDTLIRSTKHDGNIKAGEPIIFEASGTMNGVNITGQLKAGTRYVLKETEAPKGYVIAPDEWFYIPYLNQKEPIAIKMTDEPERELTKVTFIKEDFAGKEVPGATCVLTKVNPDGTTTEIDKWISTTEPRVENGILEKDTTYRYHEELAPEGYGYSETIEFTVDKDGKVVNAHYINEDGKPVLYDKDGFQTGIVVNPDGTYEHDGHKITIDANGNAVDENGEIHAEGVGFEIPVIDNVVQMKDAPTQMNLVKVGTDGKTLKGGKFQIFNTDGTPVLAIKDTLIKSTEHEGTIKKEEALIFAADGTLAGVNITGQLKAGHDYVLKELIAPSGYLIGPDTEFHIPYLNQKEPVVVKMTDEPKAISTKVTFTKEDFAGKEVPGATCVLIKVNPDGTTTEIDKWVSTTESRVEEDALEAETTYRYHEELAPEGYGYSETIEFTVDKDGKVVNAHYINEDGKPVLYDKDGFQTGIVVNPDGTYEHDGHKITIDANGNAVDENGEIHAEGVGFEIPVINNVVQMKDAPTQMNLVKVGTDGKTLKGGKFQILNMYGMPVKAVKDTLIKSTIHDGNIKAGEVLVFEADGTFAGVNITGQLKAGTNYILRELEAPSGYVKGNDVKFYIPYLNQKEPVVVRMENKPGKPDNPPEKEWESSNPQIEHSTIQFDKINGSYSESGTTTITNNKKLAGAEYTIYRNDGTVYTVVVTGQDGSATISRPPAGTYFFKETKAPEGFMIDKGTYSFTISSSGNVSGRLDIVDYKRPEVVISKKDADTKELLPGAEFKIMDSNGNVVFTGTTGSTGQFVFEPEYADTYTVIETKAPDGYDLNTTYIKFTVAENGSVAGTTTMFNTKVGQKKGSISAHYESKYNKDSKTNSSGEPNNGYGIDKYGNIIIPKSGDTFNFALISLVWLASLGCIGYVIFKKRRKDPKK